MRPAGRTAAYIITHFVSCQIRRASLMLSLWKIAVTCSSETVAHIWRGGAANWWVGNGAAIYHLSRRLRQSVHLRRRRPINVFPFLTRGVLWFSESFTCLRQFSFSDERSWPAVFKIVKFDSFGYWIRRNLLKRYQQLLHPSSSKPCLWKVLLRWLRAYR